MHGIINYDLEMPILIILSIISQEGNQIVSYNSPQFCSFSEALYEPAVE